jgi:hypothetical protein
MIQLLARNWWAIELRGALTFVFGLLALFLPGMTLGALILVFGIYALAEGTVLIVMSVNKREAPHWWVTLLQGFTGVGAGIVTFVYPGITAVALLMIIAAWAIVTASSDCGRDILWGWKSGRMAADPGAASCRSCSPTYPGQSSSWRPGAVSDRRVCYLRHSPDVSGARVHRQLE